jgi:hypothetical protein
MIWLEGWALFSSDIGTALLASDASYLTNIVQFKAPPALLPG